MKLNDLFHDGQAKSGSFFIFSSGQICLIETFPYFFQTVFGDSDTGITDRDKHFLIFGRGLNGDLGIRMTVLDRIVDQVIEHLLDLSHIGIYIGVPVGKQKINGNMFGCAGAFKGSSCIFDHSIDIKI